MQYTGNFLFDKKIHAVTCSISDDNNIYTIVHETDINGYKRKISGWAGNNYITIYGSRMVDYGKDYYKYQSQYATICSIKLNLTKSDLINNIYDFKFCFSPLNEWLETNTIFLENNKIKLLMPDDIILMNNSDVSIKIKYFKNGIEGISEATTLKNIEITPYIVVKSTKKISIKGVMNYIQMITRFFATLIGYTGNVKEIYFHNYINGKLKFDFIENTLIINTNFSNKYDIKDGYNYSGTRISYNKIKDKLSTLFSNWFYIYNQKQYNIPIILYFSPYTRTCIRRGILNIFKDFRKT